MTQQFYYDKYVLDKVSNKEIVVDVENGFIYGKRKNLNGKRNLIGCKINGKCFFTFLKKNGKTVNYPICRVIYLVKHIKIPKDHEVYHINGNFLDNRVVNLKIRKAEKTKMSHWWNDDEIDFLVDNYKKMSYDEMSIRLKRSIEAIRHKLKNIKLEKKNKRCIWTSEDDNLLVDLYRNNNLSLDEVARRMDRSKNSVRLRANRVNNIHRSDRHLRDRLNENNFYLTAKAAFQRGTLRLKCCLCKYDKYVHLHHVDNDRKNNHISNMSTLCPNHHAEVTHGEHQGKSLYAIWQRKYSDGTFGKLMNNKQDDKQVN